MQGEEDPFWLVNGSGAMWANCTCALSLGSIFSLIDLIGRYRQWVEHWLAASASWAVRQLVMMSLSQAYDICRHPFNSLASSVTVWVSLPSLTDQAVCFWIVF